jgi:hypothetical protein
MKFPIKDKYKFEIRRDYNKGYHDTNTCLFFKNINEDLTILLCAMDKNNKQIDGSIMWITAEEARELSKKLNIWFKNKKKKTRRKI